MSPSLDNVLPNGTVIRYNNNIYQIGGIKRHNNSTYYLATSSIYGWDVGEIEDSDKLFIRDGEKRICRADFRPDNIQVEEGLQW